MTKKYLVLLSLLLLGAATATHRFLEYELKVPKGVISNYDSQNLSDDYCQDASNVLFDKDLGVVKRFGYTKDTTLSTYPVRGLWKFVDVNNNQYLIKLSSSFLSYTIGDGVYTNICSTFPTAYDFTSVSYQNSQWFFSSTYTCSWSGSAGVVDTATDVPKGRYVQIFQGRLAVAGVDGNRTILYLSEYLDPTNFILGGNATDPIQFIIYGAVGDVITGLYSVGNGLLIFMNNSTWLLTGSFQDTTFAAADSFAIKDVSHLIGCIQNSSIREKQGNIYWLSKRGLERGKLWKQTVDAVMEGTIELISLPIKNKVDSIISGYDFTTINTDADTTQADFNLGITSGTNTIDLVNSVSISTPVLSFQSSDIRTGGQVSQMFYLYDSTTTGAIAQRFLAPHPTFVKQVMTGFQYKSNVTETYDAWVTLHAGTTYPSAVVLSTSNVISANTNTTGVLTLVESTYTFNNPPVLVANTSYWFVLHTTVTSPNTTVTQQVFNYTGSQQSFTVPLGVSSITVDLEGAQGNGIFTSTGGAGGYVSSSISVINGQIIYIYVGGQTHTFPCPPPFNGGGTGDWTGSGCGGGGGATDIRIGGITLANRTLIAGGGGSSGSTNLGVDTAGGTGGNSIGGNGGNTAHCSNGGGLGGTQSAGGVFGYACGTGNNGTSGSLGQGGASGGGYPTGAGGGGYYGGGGGGYTLAGYNEQGGGGGGSSFSLYGGTTFKQDARGINNIIGLNGISSFTYIAHAEFYSREINTPNLSSTTLLYTSSFTLAGSDYQDKGYDSPFTVTFCTFSFQSDVKNLGTTISKFSDFNANTTLNSGTIQFYSRSGNTTASCQSASWTPQILGATVAASALQYYQWRADLSSASSVQDVTIRWFDTQSKQNVASWVYDNRYYLACTTNSNTSATNDFVLIVDQFDNFTFFRGINALSFAEAFNQFYFGTSHVGSTNYIYYFNNSYLDDGNAIDAWIETKDYCLQDCFLNKYLQRLWVKTKNNNTGSGTMTTQVQFDGEGSYFSLGDISLSEQTGFINAKLPFPFGSNGNRCKTARFKFRNNEASQNFSYYGGKVYYTIQPPQ